MKHIFNTILLLSIFIISSCTTSNTNNSIKVQKEYGDTYDTKLITLTINRESHEFVSYNYSKWEKGISHWPGCKYCKNTNNN